MRAEWNEKGRVACEMGTRVHENCEAQLQGLTLPHEISATALGEGSREERIKAEALRRCNWLLARYTILACELIVFSPQYHIAGTIDALLRDNRTGHLVIWDWKTNEKIKHIGFNNELGIGPAAALPACDFYKYALQLSLYKFLLLNEGYTQPTTTVEHFLCHLTPERSEVIPTPYLRSEAIHAILDVCTTEQAPF